MDALDSLLAEVKGAARGWMSVPVYRRLHDTAAACRGGTLVEIGTYCGAATIALALGARLGGGGARIVTADLLRDGVGLRGASPDEKRQALRATLERFGVADSVQFVHGSMAELLEATDPRDVRLLLLDGGGRIEADLALLWERMAPGCGIVVDDVDGAVRVHRSGRKLVIDQKHRISKLLADRFVEAGLLVAKGTLDGTGWYAKGAAETDAAAIERLALPAYHALIKAEVDAGELGAARAMLRAAARRAPRLARAWRRLRPRRSS